MEKLLLHTCCAPCSIAIIDELKDTHDVTVFFYNPNIHPEEEYKKRKREVVRVCEEWHVPMIDMDYEVEEWHRAVKGLESQPEGGARCAKCFAMRLKKTVEYAAQHEFDIYSSSLTSGRNKKSDVIFPIGRSFGERYGVEFLDEDWKKKGRQEKGKCMVEERGIYRQNYCGCVYSQRSEV